MANPYGMNDLDYAIYNLEYGLYLDSINSTGKSLNDRANKRLREQQLAELFRKKQAIEQIQALRHRIKTQNKDSAKVTD